MLGTPPAFILSQDQTLMFKSDPSFRHHAFRMFWHPGSLPDFLYCHQYLLFLRCSAPSDSGTFPCPPPPKQSVRCILSDASEISLIKESFKVYPLFSYQGSDAVPKPFPRRQPVYYITFGNVCQQLFLKIRTTYILNKTEKEGFEPSRRLPDLYP